MHGDLQRFAGVPLGAKHRMNQMCSAMDRVRLKHYESPLLRLAVPGLCLHRSCCPDSHCGGWYFPHGLCHAAELGELNCAKSCQAVRVESAVMCRAGANHPLHAPGFP